MHDSTGFHTNILVLSLKDPYKKQSNDKWEAKQQKLYEQQQKEKASNIDF